MTSQIVFRIIPDSIRKLPNYIFMGCSELKSIVSVGVENICLNTFSGCYNLRHCVFSPNINIKEINKVIENNEHTDYNLSQTGIILEIFDGSMIIFSFSNFKYYYADKLDNWHIDDIITFKHNINVVIDISNGHVCIKSNYQDFKAVDLIFEYKSEFSNLSHRYLKKVNDGGLHSHMENLQTKAIKQLKTEIEHKANFDIRIIIEKIINTVNDLDINDITNSYHTSVKDWVRSKIGGDEIFFSEIHRCACYNDPFIETILPSCHYSNKEIAYTSNWNYTDYKKFTADDEEFRNSALKYYSKEKHIDYLIKFYIQSLKEAAKDSEKYLHISRAKDFLKINYNHNIKDKIKELNMSFNF